jgi:hypothetical protein
MTLNAVKIGNIINKSEHAITNITTTTTTSTTTSTTTTATHIVTLRRAFSLVGVPSAVL